VTIVLFDSGMGGLTVARAVAYRLPAARIAYVADTAAFPYGAWEEPDLVERICAVAGDVIARERPTCFVVACNTASTIALAELRARFDVPFVGTVPAVKPAAARTRTGMFSVLATPGTVRREYTQALIDDYASHCDVTLHGATGLAALAESKMHGAAVPLDAVEAEIAPAFVHKDGRRTDVVVLGCTHYPLLIDEIRAAAPWEVDYVDPADAIARRVVQVVEEAGGLPGDDEAITRAFVTSADGLRLCPVFVRFGYGETTFVTVGAL
jgi:glutamate racemase